MIMLTRHTLIFSPFLPYFPCLLLLINFYPAVYIFQMGQNSSKENKGYNSGEFFRRQVEFYRWRGDAKVNAHIARVSFEPHAAVSDRQRLKLFLSQPDHFSLADLQALASGTHTPNADQLMTFEPYTATLADLRERLGLGEVLYVLQAMLSGYEVLLAKTGRVRADLNCCFVTREGEVRIWFNRDYKSNELEEHSGEEASGCIASSEMTLIKKALELAEQLASNHTQFLHFGRQFRSFMERDILQNWNFSNSRRLINSYAYAYKLTLPPSLRDALARWTPSESSAESTLIKDEMISTSSGMLRQQPIDSRKDSQRPLSHSDYSHPRPSSGTSEVSVKTHSKKFSSTDLKNVERGKACESPKMSRSELLPNKQKMDGSPLQTQRFRREREYAVVGEGKVQKQKVGTGVRFSPMPNTFLQSPTLSGFHSLINEKEKKKQGKKKLQKKVVTVSKYIHFHQHQSQTLHSNEETSRNLAEARQNLVRFAFEDPLIESSSDNSVFTHVRNKCSEPNLAHKHSYDPTPPKDPLLQRGRTEAGRSQHSDYTSQDQTNTYPRGCITIKTVNNLLDNEVSLHESNGSFMSLDQSQGSEYHGMLCQMGRSVDILNLPSSKHVLARKPTPSNVLNRSNT